MVLKFLTLFNFLYKVISNPFNLYLLSFLTNFSLNSILIRLKDNALYLGVSMQTTKNYFLRVSASLNASIKMFYS